MVEHSISDTDITVLYEPEGADALVEYARLLCFELLLARLVGCFKYTVLQPHAILFMMF